MNKNDLSQISNLKNKNYFNKKMNKPFN